MFGIRAILIIALVGLALGHLAHGQDFPSPRGYVNDFAGVLDPESQARMEALIRRVRSQMGVEIAIVTVPSLGERPIEDYSIELARRWGIGQKGEDTGLLILVAPNERKWRIEVGYGLEGELPDGLVGEVGRRMVPYFRERKYGEGLELGLQTIVATLAQKRGVTIEDVDASLAYAPERRPARTTGLGLVLLLLVLFIVAFVLAATTGVSRRKGGRALRSRPYRDSDWLWYPIIFSGGGSGGFGGHIGGSSHGWGGFGGGGFGGFGGGSFGGGGASGSW
ncbi:MAG: TPM domain-containing protein [Blastocatellia bacterium]|nr:TPM domain-containing protein [Blastocatellia bacterium]MCS7157726.1 TPM domain-containing protein [Blastocatellia bacterium]MCX7751991.1 TPM domain-containing protein [Blastocatellia bacterium]MDW8167097.1 TPM domain-containing protein [Acidobacteriota bacterium]MDW8257201.1 TPM domain-containing protein [Acidobacteriota bacterium]